MNEYEVALRQFLEDEDYTNIEISEGYDENNFEVETDEEDMEFFVGTYDESYEAAKQDVLNLLDEIGIDSLSPDYDWTEFVDDDFFEKAYEEMVNVMYKISGGASEGECYEEYGIRCNLSEYRKFGMMLSQNLRKGTRGLTELLEREAEDAFEQRKNLAKKAGEERNNKINEEAANDSKNETCHGSVYCHGIDYDSRSKYCICGRRSTDRNQ